jgi:HK97 family phage portal protein
MKIFGLNITRASERKESPTWPAVILTLGGQNAVYTPKQYDKLIEAGYQNCAPAFSAISLIARSAAGVRWFVSRKQSDGTLVELEQNPLTDLLAYPNEYMDGYRFIESIISYKLMAGNSYVHKIHGLPSRPPKFLYVYRPDRMKVTAGDGSALVAGYTYDTGTAKVPLKTEDVLHLHDFHPLNDFYGLSRLEVAASSIDISNWSQEWNLGMLQNGMRIPGVLRLNGVTKEQSERIRKQLREEHAGSANVDKALVLENLADCEWTPTAMSAKDADWGESEKRNLRRICAVFNVWSGLLGDSESTTYSNYQEGRKALYQEAVLPELDGLRSGLNRWLVPLYGDGIVLDYDRDGIEALQEDRGKKYQYLTSADFLTTNEKREACGYDAVPDGDDVLTSFSRIPLSELTRTVYLNPDTEPATDDDEDGDEDAAKFRPLKRKSLDGFWRGDQERKALWRNFERRVSQKERAFLREVRAWLESQGRAVVKSFVAGARTPDALLDRAASERGYKDKFSSRYLRLFATALAAGRSMTEGKLYEFDGEDKADGAGISDALRAKLEKLIEEAARVITDETLSEIQAVLREATGTNLTVQEIANALKDKLVDQMPDVRARRIARTETGMLENAGNLEGFKEQEFVNRKGWLCSFVEKSRDAHIEADGQEVGIDEDFKVGGESLEYPGDRRGGASAGNVINCLCAVYPVVE